MYYVMLIVQCNSKLKSKTIEPTSKEGNQIPETDNLMKLILKNCSDSSGNLKLFYLQ